MAELFCDFVCQHDVALARVVAKDFVNQFNVFFFLQNLNVFPVAEFNRFSSSSHDVFHAQSVVFVFVDGSFADDLIIIGVVKIA